MKLSHLVEQYVAVLPLGSVLDDEQITRSLREAVRKYCGYARLASATSADGIHTPIDETNTAEGVQDFDLTPSEFAIIEPLWKMKMALENATALEASRSQGADPFGISTVDAQAAITTLEERLPQQCFSFEVRSF